MFPLEVRIFPLRCQVHLPEGSSLGRWLGDAYGGWGRLEAPLLL